MTSELIDKTVDQQKAKLRTYHTLRAECLPIPSDLANECEGVLVSLSIEAKTGAKWWADKLRNGFEPNNGSADEEGTVANLKQKSKSGALDFLFSRTHDEAQLTPDRITAFEFILAENIDELLAEDRGSYASTFGVDYHPDPILSDALSGANIKESMTTLPWKTHMSVTSKSVKVADGYGAPWVELLS